jgi:hypothetical protein
MILAKTAISVYPNGFNRVALELEVLCTVYEAKVKLSLYRPWRPLGLREVEAPTFTDIRHTDVSALRAGRFLPPGRFLVLIFVRG